MKTTHTTHTTQTDTTRRYMSQATLEWLQDAFTNTQEHCETVLYNIGERAEKTGIDKAQKARMITEAKAEFYGEYRKILYDLFSTLGVSSDRKEGGEK